MTASNGCLLQRLYTLLMASRHPTCIHSFTHSFIPSYVHTLIHSYIRTHIHTHTHVQRTQSIQTPHLNVDHLGGKEGMIELP